MMGNCRFFAGGNTADGFVSFFPYILPATECDHMYYVKGGPGVGKSSTMKQIGALMEQKGCFVEYFDCSGDPDSVDGITITKKNSGGHNIKIGLIDATAPHSYDPAVPGARDTLVSLGDFLDENALASHKYEIQELANECSAIYRQCYAYLNAAGSVLRTTLQYEWKNGVVRKAVNELLEQSELLPHTSEMVTNDITVQQGGTPVRHLFAEAYTYKGFLSHLNTLQCDQTFVLIAPIGQSADFLLQVILDELMLLHVEVIALHEPLRPTLLSHLYLPKQRVLFTSDSGFTDHSTSTVEIFTESNKLLVHDLRQSGLLQPGIVTRGEAFDEELFQKLTECAIKQLQSAKAAHDELETYYVKNMDFAGWKMKLDTITQAIYNQISGF